MEIFDLIFRLIQKFVPIERDALMQLQNDAKDWRIEIAREDHESWFGNMYKKIHKSWMVRGLIALMYIPLVNSIQRSMVPEEEAEFIDY
jgi:hypothetical protein